MVERLGANPLVLQIPVFSGLFHVLNNDLIAGVRFRKGTYQMTALGGVTCTKASSLFKRFLREAQESLPGRWRLKKASGKFLRGHRGKGFQVNLWS